MDTLKSAGWGRDPRAPEVFGRYALRTSINGQVLGYAREMEGTNALEVQAVGVPYSHRTVYTLEAARDFILRQRASRGLDSSEVSL